jgi:xanthine/uracil permease
MPGQPRCRRNIRRGDEPIDIRGSATRGCFGGGRVEVRFLLASGLDQLGREDGRPRPVSVSVSVSVSMSMVSVLWGRRTLMCVMVGMVVGMVIGMVLRLVIGGRGGAPETLAWLEFPCLWRLGLGFGWRRGCSGNECDST